MFCNNCGKELPEGTKFCNNCGASQDAVPSNHAEKVVSAQATTQKNNTVKYVIIAVIAVVCFAIGAFVIAPSFSKNDTAVNTDISQSQGVSEKEDTQKSNDADNTDTLKAIDGGSNTGKAFLSDMGEYGKVSLSIGYNEKNGVVRQVAASFTITVRHSEYDDMKSDFEAYEERLSNSKDKNIEATYVELGESVSFIIGIKGLNEADRADRVALAEEILDFVADEDDCAFYVDNITDLLVNTYGFTVVD